MPVRPTSRSRGSAPFAVLGRLALGAVALGSLGTGAAHSGCNFTELAANQTVEVFHEGARSFQKESDVELARAAGFSNLKLVESLLEVVPDNTTLLALCARSFTEYTFAFIEDDMERLDEFDPRYEVLMARSLDFYGRAKKYGTRWLEHENSELAAALTAPLDEWKAALQSAKKDDAQALFWVLYPWGSAINLTQDDPASLIEVPKVLAGMQRVIELDERIYNSVPHAFLGGVYATLPAALGGNPADSKLHFDRALELEGDEFLLTHVLYATFYYTRAEPNRERFEEHLQFVLDAPADIDPDRRLPNELAKVRAARWLEQADELF